MKIIAPSLLSANFLNLESDIKALNNSKDLWLHLDIMDGHFVPNITFGPVVLKNISKITKHKLDAHLMVKEPRKFISYFKNLDIYNLTVHFEALKGDYEVLDLIAESFSSVGLSIKPNTKVEDLPIDVLKKINLLLVMSVEPGFGGQEFMPESLTKIEQLIQIKKTHQLDFIIEVDGGITNNNAKELFAVGADVLVAGSYIFKSGPDKFNEQIEKLKED